MLRDSGPGYTVLRVAWYAENLTDLGLLPRVLAAGRWYTSAGEGRISYVPLADVAHAAAAALAAEDDQSHVYDITGREALSVPQIALVAGEVFGTPLTVVQVSDEHLATELTALGVPAPCVPLVVVTDANTRAGNFDLATDTIERLTGTKPQSLQEFFCREQDGDPKRLLIHAQAFARNWTAHPFCFPMQPDQIQVVLKRFEAPDETCLLEKGKFEVVRLGGLTVGRAIYEPGWRWSEHVGPGVGASRCSVEHVGLVLSGTATAAFDDGRVFELRAGELFYIPPVPHDSWVVGDEPYVSLHLLGADHYAR